MGYASECEGNFSRGQQMLRRTSLGVLSLALFFTSLSAQAIPILWTLNDVFFDDGGTAVGSFVYDADLNMYSEINVQTTAGTELGASSYADPHPNFGTANQAVFLSAPWSSDLTGETDLALYFLTALTNAGGTAGIQSGFSSFEVICPNADCTGFSTSTSRDFIPDGSVTGVPAAVPAPAALLLMLTGLGAMFGMSRRRKV